MDQLAQHIESIVFVSESPISFKEIKSCLEETFETKLKKTALEKAIEALKDKYQAVAFSFEFLEIAGGFQFLTKPAFHNSVGTLLRQNNKRRLSRAALETLSIIAYKQPVPKSEMEKIRGVSCDYSVQKLLEKELVAIVGRSDAPGRPLLYGTSEKFMDYFGLKNLDEMPKPKDFQEPDNEIGEQAPIDETTAAAPIIALATDIEPTVKEGTVIETMEETMAVEDVIPTAAADTTTLSENAIVEEKEEVAVVIEEVIPTAAADTTMLSESAIIDPIQETEIVEDVIPTESTDTIILGKDVADADDLAIDTEDVE